jgi:RNA polymerase sigma-70 factor (ECF subfamily)
MSDRTDSTWARVYSLQSSLARWIGRLPELPSPADAADVAQETFVRVLKNFTILRPLAPGQVRAWLRTTARNVARDLKKKRRPRPLPIDGESGSGLGNGGLPPPVSPLPSPSAEAAQRELAERLLAAIDGLPKNQRRAITLYWLDDLPAAEVAREMGRDLGSVAGLLRNGMRGLRKALAEEPSGGLGPC